MEILIIFILILIPIFSPSFSYTLSPPPLMNFELELLDDDNIWERVCRLICFCVSSPYDRINPEGYVFALPNEIVQEINDKFIDDRGDGLAHKSKKNLVVALAEIIATQILTRKRIGANTESEMKI